MYAGHSSAWRLNFALPGVGQRRQDVRGNAGFKAAPGAPGFDLSDKS
jgi:hypothetical protein